MAKEVVLLLMLFVFAASLIAAGDARAADDGIDEDLMRSVEDTNKSLASNLALADAPASTADARELLSMFRQISTYFSAKPDADEGISLSKKSLALTGEIIKLVEAKNFDAATATATDLSRTCKSCHKLYKKS